MVVWGEIDKTIFYWVIEVLGNLKKNQHLNTCLSFVFFQFHTCFYNLIDISHITDEGRGRDERERDGWGWKGKGWMGMKMMQGMEKEVQLEEEVGMEEVEREKWGGREWRRKGMEKVGIVGNGGGGDRRGWKREMRRKGYWEWTTRRWIWRKFCEGGWGGDRDI